MLEEKTFPYDNFLQIFSFHCATIATMLPNDEFTFSPVGNLEVKVKAQNLVASGEVQFLVNGKWSGNKWGATKEFARLTKEYIEKN